MKKQLFVAAESGNISKLREALRSVPINTVNELGETPLMVACKHGHVELTKFILSRGADTTIVDSSGKSARELIAASHHSETSRVMNGVQEAQSSKTKILGDRLVSLATNIFSVFKESNTFTDEIDDELKKIIRLDLAKIILLLRRQEEVSLYDGLGLGLTMFFLSTNAQLDEQLSDIKDASEDGLVEIANQMLIVAKKLNPNKVISETNFEFESIYHLNPDVANRMRKVFYEFSELIVKADGVVTEQESKALKFLSHKLFATKDEGMPVSQQTTKATLDSILNNLNNLVGMENIKSDIMSLINIIKSNQLRKNEGLPEQKVSMHSVFLGPPGTGKTTIARMMADIYYSLGRLNKNNFVEVDRSGMVAGYVGQTAIKVDEVIGKALDGVLFIDEAYTLSRSNSENDFGQEAIDILLKRMEDSRDKLVVIVAGYEEEMLSFINSNPGLKSRFNRIFYFHDYTPIQLMEIFNRISNVAGFVLTVDASQKLRDLFDVLYTRRDTRFGNARLVRNIFEKTFEKHANRTANIAPITRTILTTIQKEDVPYDEFINAA